MVEKLDDSSTKANGVGMKIREVEDLTAWQKARDLSEIVFKISSSGKFAKEYWLRDQINKAATSVAANIAEGFEREGDREYRHFLSVAKGSAAEVRTHANIAGRVGLVTSEESDQIRDLARETSRVIGGLMRSLETAEASHPKSATAQSRKPQEDATPYASDNEGQDLDVLF